jgi:hypothetical protein
VKASLNKDVKENIMEKLKVSTAKEFSLGQFRKNFPGHLKAAQV